MRYIAEQIMPKRYPDERPIKEGTYWTYDDELKWGWDDYTDSKKVFSFDRTKWFIDVPGAPNELEPLAYPENKPSKNGMYLAHSKNTDKWKVTGYYKKYLTNGYWDNVIDWFIPYRLDEPVSNTCQLESEDAKSVVEEKGAWWTTTMAAGTESEE